MECQRHAQKMPKMVPLEPFTINKQINQVRLTAHPNLAVVVYTNAAESTLWFGPHILI